MPARSLRRGPGRRCAARATTGPTSGPTAAAGSVGVSPRSVCGPPRPAPMSASTATSYPSASVCGAGDNDRAPGWRPARQHVSVAFLGRRHPARTAAPFAHRRRVGPRDRCATPATPLPCAGGGRARDAVSNDGWCHHQALAPPAAVTAPGSPRCTPATPADAKTNSMSGAAATDAHSPGAPPRQ